PLLKGRDFTDNDRVTTPNVFIVNEAFARKFLPADDPLSASISVFMQTPDRGFGRVIGVVGDVKEGSLRGGPQPTVFYTYRQLLSPGMTLFVRSTRGAELSHEVEQMVRAIDPNLPVVEVRMLADAFSESIGRERLNAVVSGAFAVCALLLASLGLYGLLAFTVANRTNEIGIRLALGAQASRVLAVVMQEGLALVALGGGIGLAIAFGLSGFLETFVFGVKSYDPLTFGAVAALLLLVSVLAILIPALRATQINPLVALRNV